MTGTDLRSARLARKWTQVEAARRLEVSQGYLSMLERGRRPVPDRLLRRLRNLYELPVTSLPLRESNKPYDAQHLAKALAALGYPGFAYLRKGVAAENPAVVLFRALLQHDLEPRLSAALPWVLLRYPDLDWAWLLQHVKLHNLQNRLGFAVSVAQEVAKKKDHSQTFNQLARQKTELNNARLAQEGTYCHDKMTTTERRWLRDQRSPLAKHWHLLTDLTLAELPYAA